MIDIESSTILVVDDDQQILNFILKSLKKYIPTSKVYSTKSAKVVIDLVEEHSPDVILLDIKMNGISGLDVCKKLKSLDHTRNIPVILMTGIGNSYFSKGLLDFGADAFLSKPISMNELHAQVKAMLRIKRAEDIIKENACIELEKSEKKYYKLFDNMVAGCVYYQAIYDNDNNLCDYKYLDVNDAWCKSIGISKEDVIGKTAKESSIMFGPIFISSYKSVMKYRKPKTFCYLDKELNKYYLINVYNTNGNTFACTFIDITRRKQIEEVNKKNNIILTKLAKATNWIMQNDLQNISFEKLLGSFGKLFNVSRVYLYEKRDSEYMCLYHWLNPNNETNVVPMKLINDKTDFDLSMYVNKLMSTGKSYTQVASKLTEFEKDLYIRRKIQSIIIIPIFNRDKSIYGLLGMDCSHTERQWDDLEISVLELISAVLSTVIYKLSDSNIHQVKMNDLASQVRKFKSSLNETLSTTRRTLETRGLL